MAGFPKVCVFLWKNQTNSTPELLPQKWGGGDKSKYQILDSVSAPPEPSLWNSAIGRRAFLKKTGAATAATALALQASKMEVLAQQSGLADKVLRFTTKGTFTPYPMGFNPSAYPQGTPPSMEDVANQMNQYNHNQTGPSQPSTGTSMTVTVVSTILSPYVGCYKLLGGSAVPQPVWNASLGQYVTTIPKNLSWEVQIRKHPTDP